MTDIKPRFFDTPLKLLAHLEWEAIQVICFNGSRMDMGDAFPKFEQRRFYWIDPFNDKATDEHHSIKSKILRKEYQTLDDFYAALKPLLKPKPKGKALKDKKKRTAQSAYQREKLGDAFIENDALISAAKACAYNLSEAFADAHAIAVKAAELVVMHNNNEALTEPQMTELCALIQRQIDRHQKPDNIESKLIDEDNKNLYFMWGKVKRRYPVNDTFAWPSKEAAKVCGCSKSDVGPIMQKLEKLGAISLVQAGKPGKHSGRAAIYRREI